MMLVARVAKELVDVRRVILDWTKWLDPGEQVGSLMAGPTISVLWPDNYYDETPLTVQFSSVEANGTQTRFMFTGGTPGLVYMMAAAFAGSSTRVQGVEIVVAVRHSPGIAAAPSGGDGGGDGGGGSNGPNPFVLDRSLLDGPDLLS